jgi:fumarate reductase subunit D
MVYGLVHHRNILCNTKFKLGVIEMSKISKAIIIFIISFIISYLIVGYVANAVFAQIHWVEGATVWDKFIEYYIRTASINAIPTFILAIIIEFY